jgi:hypothetical protein
MNLLSKLLIKNQLELTENFPAITPGPPRCLPISILIYIISLFLSATFPGQELQFQTQRLREPGCEFLRVTLIGLNNNDISIYISYMQIVF